MAYTTTEFVEHVKTRAAVPTSQSTFTTAKILDLGDAEIRSYIVPIIISAQEYFYAHDTDITINSTGVYDVPKRSVGGKLINAALIDGNQRHDLDWITEEELIRTDETESGTPGILFKKNKIHLIPAERHNFSTIRLTYPIRPGELVETSAAAKITAIDTGTKTLSFSSGTIPSTFTTSKTYDLIQATPHFDHLAIDQSVTTITSTTMVFSTSLPTDLVIGDWVALATESPIVQVPLELHPLLEHKVATTLVRAQGDLEHTRAMEKELSLLEKRASNIYTPRIEKEGKKIVLRNRLLRRL